LRELDRLNELVTAQGGRHELEGEALFLKGDLLLLLDGAQTAEAEECFRSAIEIAQRQGAKTRELAYTSRPARLLVRQGHRQEARVILADIYNWFTEGFDTADLKEAKALLDELSSDPAICAPARGRKLRNLKSRQPQRIGPTGK